MAVISAGTTTTTALVQTGDTTGNLVIKTGSSGTTALTVSGADQSVTFAGGINLGALTTSGNLTFTGTGNRITGDFSNGTVANRALFQTSTTDSLTLVTSIPNGTSQIAGFAAFNSSTPTNASWADLRVTDTIVALRSNTVGTGTALPMTFFTGGSERLRIDTSGNVGIGTSSPSGKLQIQTDTNKNAIFTNATHDTLTGLGTAITFSRANDGVAALSALMSWNNGGIALAARESIAFATGGAGLYSATTERMRIDASGNVGIGVSNPGSARLAIDSGAGALMATFNSTNASGGYSAWATSGTVIADIGTAQSCFGAGGSDTFAINGRGARSLLFGTNNTERMRIDSSGNLLVGTTSAISAGRGVFRGVQGSLTSLSVEATGTGNHYQVVFNNSNGTVGIISTNGSTTTYGTSSDYRLKENISPMTGALATVQALKPVTYNWKVDGSAGQGFIAHELQEVVPDAVVGAKDAVDAEGKPQYQGIDTSFLVATLTAAIQELNAKVTALEAQLENK